MPRNQARVPRPVHGPWSMARIWWTVHHHPAAATAKSAATRTTRTRTAAKAGASPPPAGTRSRAGALIGGSGGPGELGGGQAGLALVPDPEGVDPRAPRLGHGQVRRDRVEHAVELDGRPIRLPERDDVLDLEVDDIADPDAVPQPVAGDRDGRPFDPGDLTHQRRQGRHRPAEL